MVSFRHRPYGPSPSRRLRHQGVRTDPPNARSRDPQRHHSAGGQGSYGISRMVAAGPAPPGSGKHLLALRRFKFDAKKCDRRQHFIILGRPRSGRARPFGRSTWCWTTTDDVKSMAGGCRGARPPNMIGGVTETIRVAAGDSVGGRLRTWQGVESASMRRRPRPTVERSIACRSHRFTSSKAARKSRSAL